MRIERNPVLAAGLILLALPSGAAGAQSWTPLGSSNTVGGVSAMPGPFQPTVAIDAAGNPTVAWAAAYGGGAYADIYLRTWDPGTGAWIERSLSASGTGVSGDVGEIALTPSVAVDASGTPVVAWVDITGSSRMIYCAKPGLGGVWEGPGGAGTEQVGAAGNSNISAKCSLALDASGRPWVAWQRQISGIVQIALKYWNGSAWTELAGSITGGAVTGLPSGERADDPSLSLDAAGIPHVAYIRVTSTNARLACVKRCTGTQWSGISGSESGLDVNHVAQVPSISVASTGTIVAAWHDTPAGAATPLVYVIQYAGGAWSFVGGGPIGDPLTPAIQPTIAVDAMGRPFVSWLQTVGNPNLSYANELRAARWTGSAWADLTASGLAGFRVSACAGAMNARGDVVLAWTDGSDGQVHSMRRTNPGASILAAEQWTAGPPSTLIPPGSVTDTTGLDVRIDLSAVHPDGHSFRAHVRVKPVGSPFDGSEPVFAGTPGTSTVTALLTGLVYGTRYQWEAWTEDDLGAYSAILAYQTSNPAECDFFLRTNYAPTLSAHQLLDAGTLLLIQAGGSASSLSGVLVQASGDDLDGDRYRVVVECRPATESLVGVATSIGPLVTNHDPAGTQFIPVEQGNVAQLCLQDEYGKQSAWSRLTSAAPGDPDFTFQPRGSTGVPGCSQAGSAAFPGPRTMGWVLAAGLVLLRRRAIFP